MESSSQRSRDSAAAGEARGSEAEQEEDDSSEGGHGEHDRYGGRMVFLGLPFRLLSCCRRIRFPCGCDRC